MASVGVWVEYKQVSKERRTAGEADFKKEERRAKRWYEASLVPSETRKRRHTNFGGRITHARTHERREKRSPWPKGMKGFPRRGAGGPRSEPKRGGTAQPKFWDHSGMMAH